VRILALLTLLLGLSGCAGIAELRMPQEFKGKKQIEDPPLTWQGPSLPGGRRSFAGRAAA
jgi:hypothetical protein